MNAPTRVLVVPVAAAMLAAKTATLAVIAPRSELKVVAVVDPVHASPAVNQATFPVTAQPVAAPMVAAAAVLAHATGAVNRATSRASARAQVATVVVEEAAAPALASPAVNQATFPATAQVQESTAVVVEAVPATGVVSLATFPESAQAQVATWHPTVVLVEAAQSDHVHASSAARRATCRVNAPMVNDDEVLRNRHQQIGRSP